MNPSTFIGLLNNAALMIALGFVFDTIVLKPGFEKTSIKILAGIVFGLLGVAVMMTPWEVLPGVFFDTRSVILCIGGLFFGTIPTLIAVLITGLVRLFQGGIGAWTGIAVIVTSGSLGVLWRHKRAKALDSMSQMELYIFGIIVHIAMLCWMLSLPWVIAKNVLSNISVSVMVLYPIGTLLLGKLMLARLNRKKDSDALLESEARWRSLTESSPDHIFILDNELNIQFANFALPGLTVTDLIGTLFFQYVEGKEKQKKVKETLEIALRTGDQQSYETEYLTPDGHTIYYESTVTPRILEGSTDIVGLTVTSRNITERKQAEQNLLASERFLNTAFENIPNMIFVKDAKDLRFVRINKAGADLLGYSSEELIGKSDYDFFIKEEADFFIRMDKEVLKKGTMIDILEESIKTRYKGERKLHTKKIPLKDNKGIPEYLLGISEDITEQKRAEDLIKASLKEKETLLQEIHHRVKNNMQVIASLLNLQAGAIKSKRVRELLRESQSRVHAMAAVHETLHESDRLSEINLQFFLFKITYAVFDMYSIAPERIVLINEIEELPISIKQATPLGLIINELMSNALKYAFPNDRKGQITVAMKKIDNDFELTVMDDGVGFPEELDWLNSKSLGLKLVRSLAEDQLGGSVEMESTNGTKFIIKFNIET